MLYLRLGEERIGDGIFKFSSAEAARTFLIPL